MKKATEKEKEAMNATEWVDYYQACETELFNQPQLTIPKSIADTLDIAIKGLTEFEDYLWAVDEFDALVPYDKVEYFRKWSNEEMNAHALAVLYVTGKALGVDLVKVVEG